MLEIIRGDDVGGQLNGATTHDNVLIRPRWKGDTFDMQYDNLDNLNLTEGELKKKRVLFVRLLYTSHYAIDDNLYQGKLKSKIQSGKFKKPLLYKSDTKKFEGSYLLKKFQNHSMRHYNWNRHYLIAE